VWDFVVLGHNTFDILFLLEFLEIEIVWSEVLLVLLLVTPLELIHHVVAVVSHKGQTEGLLKTLLCSLQGHVLVAEDLREEGA
jgi:hypothetical protein